MPAVIFDMDGTLFDTESLFQAEWSAIAQKRGVVLPPSFKYDICGTSGAPMLAIIEKYYHVADGRAIRHECQQYVEGELQKKVPLKKGCLEILSFLRDWGIPMAIGSSSTLALIRSNLAVSGTAPFFSAIASGEEVEHGKPAPDIFLLAARRLQRAPSDCFVFEDSPNGIRAAKAAGMKPILIPDLIPVTEDIEHMAFRIFPDLLAAKNWLAVDIFSKDISNSMSIKAK